MARSLPLKYEKGQFRIISDDSRLLLGDVYRFQFNPSSITDTRNVDYAVTKPIQSEQPIYEHLSRGERVVKFQLFINGMEDQSGYIASEGKQLRFNNPLLDGLSRRVERGAIGLGAKLLPFAEGIGTGISLAQNLIGGRQTEPKEAVAQRKVNEDIEFLESLMQGDGVSPPPEIQFLWPGYRTSTWIVTDLKFKTNFFTKKMETLH